MHLRKILVHLRNIFARFRKILESPVDLSFLAHKRRPKPAWPAIPRLPISGEFWRFPLVLARAHPGANSTLGNHPARFAPACLIAEVGAEPPDLVRWPSDRALEQIGDPGLKDLVNRNADRIFDPLGFEALVDSRHGKGGIGTEVDAQDFPDTAR